MINRIKRHARHLLAMLCLLLAAAPALAQQDNPNDALDQVRKQITSVQQGLERSPADAELLKMRNLLQDAGAKAAAVAEELAPELTGIEARLSELGAPTPGAKEAPDIAAQRSALDTSRRDLDAQVKLARLLAVEAEQVAGEVAGVRRSLFQARLGERTESILSRAFWLELRHDVPNDLGRLQGLGRDLADAVRNGPLPLWLGLLAAALAVIAFRVRAGQMLLGVTAARVAPGRLRRSLHALLEVVLSVAAPALVAQLLLVGLHWNRTLAPMTEAFLADAAGALAFGGFVAGIGYALLSPERPTWRLLPVTDPVALALHRWPLLLGGAMVVAWLVQRLAALANATLATTVAINCLVAVVLGLALAYGLWRGARAWRRMLLGSEQPLHPAAGWIRVGISLSWLALGFCVLSLAAGFVAFAAFVARQLAWGLVVVSSAHLLMVLVEDASMKLRPGTDAMPGLREQGAVLLSGFGRVVVVLLAIMLLAAPYGESPAELLNRAGQLHEGIALGEVRIQPGSLLSGLLILIAALVGIKVVKRWLLERYLPTTGLDPGMQLSAGTLFGYLGAVIAFSLALSSAGIGLERVAWIASALSVGIGFGLQAVVQNFVSGLILLAERPVKVGDWVALGGIEGDIRRINVRATEIQMGDRSTVIVPNSEFITKTVRNVTHTNSLGLVQVKLPLPLDTDAQQVRAMMLAAFAAHPDVQESPAPNVQLDGIEVDKLVFNGTGFVASPRMAYAVRSAVLFDVLQRLRAAGWARDLTQAPAPVAAPAPDSPLEPPPQPPLA